MDTLPGTGQHFGSLLPTPPPLHSNTNKGRREATSLLALGGCSGRGKTLMSSVMLEPLNQGWTPLSVVAPLVLPPAVYNRRKLNPREVAPPLGAFTKDEKEVLWLLKFLFQCEQSLSVGLCSWDDYKISPWSNSLVNFHWQISHY